MSLSGSATEALSLLSSQSDRTLDLSEEEISVGRNDKTDETSRNTENSRILWGFVSGFVRRQVAIATAQKEYRRCL